MECSNSAHSVDYLHNRMKKEEKKNERKKVTKRIIEWKQRNTGKKVKRWTRCAGNSDVRAILMFFFCIEFGEMHARLVCLNRMLNSI